MSQIRRREFLLATVALLAAPPLAAAQAEKTYRVAWVLAVSTPAEMAGPNPAHSLTRELVHSLRDLGYIEGRNLILDRRSAEGRPERYPAIVAELLRLEPDVIVMTGIAGPRAAKEATRTVPIVMCGVSQPVENGLVESLARPGGNVTGVTGDSGPEEEAKRLQLLKEAVPHLRSVAYLSTGPTWEGLMGRAVRDAARTMGLALVHAEHLTADLKATFAAIGRQRPEALFASFSPETFAHRPEIARFVVEQRLPGIYPYTVMADAGGLMAYGVPQQRRGINRCAHYVDRILKGAKPADVPVEQPASLVLVLNRKAARALGLTFPPSLLSRADRVIE
jgi:putative tryptophan/tyrosine transport system substrate-binding protein